MTNKKVENMEIFNVFSSNSGVELARTFYAKQRYEIDTITKTIFCFLITSESIHNKNTNQQTTSGTTSTEANDKLKNNATATPAIAKPKDK